MTFEPKFPLPFLLLNFWIKIWDLFEQPLLLELGQPFLKHQKNSGLFCKLGTSAR